MLTFHIRDLGLPKPIVLTQGFIGTLDTTNVVPPPPGRLAGIPSCLGPDDIVLTTVPYFHLMGCFLLFNAVFHFTKLLIPPEKPPTPDYVADLINIGKPTVAVLTPSVIEDMSHYRAGMDAMGQLKYVYFAGAPLSPDAGNRVNLRTRIVSFLGSSEMGLLLSILPEHKEDWEYFEWNPLYGIDMQPVGEDKYELVVKRAKNRDIEGIFHTYPDLTEYHTKDLFTPHLSRPNLWKYSGRFDDVIVLSNGEKFNPVGMEKIIEGHPLVSRALVVGQARFQSALLVEPNWALWKDNKPFKELVAQIWPVVQEANRVSPAYGRVVMNKIGVSSKDKPFEITSKGTVQRRHVNTTYKNEIDQIYAKDDQGDTEEYGTLQGTNLAQIEEFVHKVVSHIAEVPDFPRQADFYEKAGIDSLQTMELSKAVQHAIHSGHPDKNYGAITPQKVYANPTIEKLSRAVYGIIHGAQETEIPRRDKIDGLVQKYTASIPQRSLGAVNASDKHAVILTGSTGSLGNYLLNGLLNDPDVVKVYCLNRSDAKERQIKSFQEKGLDFTKLTTDRVEFLKVSFGAEKFGLGIEKYEEMLQSVDTIIHNAWRVDFNITVDSFVDPHIKGLRHFIDFSLHSSHHAHIHFVSSVATVGGWNPDLGPSVPEIPIEDCDAVLEQGYGESKHVSERICLAAARKAGVPVTIHRVGQIAGPTSPGGQWNKQEWAPSAIATSISMGKVPNSMGEWGVDWIPVVSFFLFFFFFFLLLLLLLLLLFFCPSRSLHTW